jgi:hypothetical protein
MSMVYRIAASAWALLRGYAINVGLFLSFRHPGWEHRPGEPWAPRHTLVLAGFVAAALLRWLLVQPEAPLNPASLAVLVWRLTALLVFLWVAGGAPTVFGYMAFSTGTDTLGMASAIALPPHISDTVDVLCLLLEFAFVVRSLRLRAKRTH